MSKFQRLIRFQDPQGEVHYGELGSSGGESGGYAGQEVNIYGGATPWSEDFHPTGKKATIEKVGVVIPHVEVTIS